MCGICGYITSEDISLTDEQKNKRHAVFDTLLAAMEDRGNQSTGFALINSKTGYWRIKKRAVAASEFINEQSYENIWKKNPDANIGIGHTRLATMGSVCRRNAHPWKKGTIFGMHNGSVHNFDELKEKYAKDKHINVDSEIIFEMLNNMSPADTYKELRGMFAIAFYNEKDKLFRMVRSGNPIEIIYVPEIKTLFFASLFDPLKYAALAFKLKYERVTLDYEKQIVINPANLKHYEEAVSFASLHTSGKNSYYYGGEWFKDDDETKVVVKDSGTKKKNKHNESVENNLTNILEPRDLRCGNCDKKNVLNDSLVCSSCKYSNIFECTICDKNTTVEWDDEIDIYLCESCSNEYSSIINGG